MIYRNFKQISTGKWLNVLMTAEGNEFSVAAQNHREQIALGWSLPLADVKVVDGVADARTGILVQGPLSPLPIPDPDEAAFIAGTVAEKLEILARRSGLKGVG